MLLFVVIVSNGHVTHNSSLTSDTTLLSSLFFLGGGGEGGGGVSLTCDCSTGDTRAMCSCMIKQEPVCFWAKSPSGARCLIGLIKACASSPPCSPRRPKPSPVLCMKSAQCISKICCLGEMRVPGNLLLKNAMYLSSAYLLCHVHPFPAKDRVWDSCAWTTAYREFSVLESLLTSFAIAWQSLSLVVLTVFLTTWLSQMCAYAGIFRYLWQWMYKRPPMVGLGMKTLFL